MKLEFGHVAIHLCQLLEHLPILVGRAYYKFIPYPKGYLACAIDSVCNQQILCQGAILLRQIISIPRLTLQCILTQSNEKDCFRPLILSQCHTSLSPVILRLRPLSLAVDCPGCSYLHRQYAREPTNYYFDCPSLRHVDMSR
jgi:hypothetical protein